MIEFFSSRVMGRENVLCLLFVILVMGIEFLLCEGAPTTSSGTLKDAAGLLRFKAYADSAGRLNSLWKSRDPCKWKGVMECNNGRVVRVVIEQMELNGTFPENTLNQLDQLRVLSLKGNKLRGPVPDLTGLDNLKSLFLDHNMFTGPIPPSIPSLHRLKVIGMSNNFLSGDIPDEFVKLPRLSALFLENNRLEGSLPSFNQSTLKLFNVSYNQLSGEVPDTISMRNFKATSFLGNPKLCGKLLGRSCILAQSPSPSSDVIASSPIQEGLNPPLMNGKGSKGLGVGKVIGIALGCGFGFLTIVLLGVLYCKKDRGVKIPEDDTEKGSGDKLAGDYTQSDNQYFAAAPMAKSLKAEAQRSGILMFCGGEAHMYTLEDLLRANAEIMGRGTLGTTYKALMENKMVVTVKRLKNSGKLGRDDFERQMEMVGKLRHQNIVSLRAYFQAKDERLLVYDYYSNGSLFSLLHGSRSATGKPLHWTSCFKIAEDVAAGLSYLHQASRLFHGNLKPSNVMLGADFEACITDYGLTVFDNDKPEDPDMMVYKAPECIKSTRKTGPKSDVYSFGVLILELLTGKVPLQSLLFGQPEDLQRWVRCMREEEGETHSYGVDGSLSTEDTMMDDEKLMLLLDIAMSCLAPSPERRPTMRQVLKMVEEAKDLQSGSSHSTESSKHNGTM